MKNLIIALSFLCSFFLMGGEPKGQDDRYCAKIIDGRMVVVYHGEPITNDVKLADGSILHPDGNIVKPDGTTTMLREGECVRKEAGMEDKKNKPPKKQTAK
jgi:hypothetical protein